MELCCLAESTHHPHGFLRAEGWRQQKQQALSFPSPSRKRIIKRSIAEENCRRGGFHMNFFLCSVLIK